jgi:endonuclease-3 related protein
MSILRKIYETLREHYDVQPVKDWWLDNPVDVIIGSVLAQGTTWKMAVKILDLLRGQSLLDFRALKAVDENLLSNLIKSAGFQTKKVRRLKELSEIFLRCADGNVNTFFARDVELVRQELMRINGIAPATVDNIILYAGKLPIYVVDPYTVRIFLRHEVVSESANNADIQQLIHFELTPDEEPYGAELFSEFQAYMVKLGNTFCTMPTPDCSKCPLAELLPINGPRNENIPIETTIPTIPIISANRLRLKKNRKLPTLKFTQIQTKNTNTTKTKNSKPQTTQPKTNEQKQNITNTQKINIQKNNNIDNSQKNQIAPAPIKLNETEQKIFDQIGYEPTQIDSIVQTTNLPVHIVRASIAILEMKKILRQVEGNRVARC